MQRIHNDIGFGAALRSFFQLLQQQSIACGAAVPERFQSATCERATAPKSCRKRSALLASKGTVAPPLTSAIRSKMSWVVASRPS